MKHLTLLSLLLALLVCLTACGVSPAPTPETAPAATEAPVTAPPVTEPPATEAPPTEPPRITEESSATILVTGDIMSHLPVVNAGYTGSGYRYDRFFR